MRAVIVDDEELARQLLREQLRDAGGVEVIAECANGFEAVKAITELKPDVLFLDIQMPKLDGFEVLELIGAETPIVFVTAFDQYAMKAFEAHAIDYLLKPYSLERFQKSIEKLRALPKSAPTGLASLAAEVRPADHRPERIVVRDGAKAHGADVYWVVTPAVSDVLWPAYKERIGRFNKIYEDTGATPVEGALTTYYTNIQTGVTQGALSFASGIAPARVQVPVARAMTPSRTSEATARR